MRGSPAECDSPQQELRERPGSLSNWPLKLAGPPLRPFENETTIRLVARTKDSRDGKNQPSRSDGTGVLIILSSEIAGKSGVHTLNSVPTNQESLAEFILLRWDQLDELADLLAAESRERSTWTVDASLLGRALTKIADRRLRLLASYISFCRDRDSARRDHDKIPVYKVANKVVINANTVSSRKGWWALVSLRS
jgi:hypothetical protein